MRGALAVAVALAAGAAAALGGCSGDGGTTTPPDAGAPEPDASPVPAPAPPAEAALPRLACAPGWRAVGPEAPSGVSRCDPWPASGRAACPLGEVHLPGEPGCRRLGPACAGDWATDLPDDRPIVYVKAGAAPGGDGTGTAPLATIAEAITAAPAGAVIALARGTYEEVVTLPGGLALWGACATETVVTSAEASTTAAVLTPAGPGAEARNLRLVGARPAVRVGGGASLALRDVVIWRATHAAVIVNGGALAAEGLVIAETQRTSGAWGRALSVRAGSAQLADAALDGNGELAIDAQTGAVIGLADVVIAGTRGGATGNGGIAIYAEYGAKVDGARVALDGNQETAIMIWDPGTRVRLEDAVIRGTVPRPDGNGGNGAIVRDGGRLELERVTVGGNTHVGILATGADVTVVAIDVIVRDTQAVPGGTFGRGLEVTWSAQATLDRVALVDNREFGVFVARQATVDGRDVVVADTRARATDGWFGRGINVQWTAQVTLERVRLARNREIGAVVGHEGSVLALTDVVIVDTESDGNGRHGRGLGLQERASARVTRGLITGSREASVAAFGDGTSLAMVDVIVEGTRPAACAETTCPTTAGGIGLVATTGAAIDVTRFAVRDHAQVGVMVSRGGVMDLREGEISRNPVGANVQTAGFDVARLMDRVVYRDNGVNLDTSALPVPEPPAPGP